MMDDKLPPHNIEAEEAVLASLLVDIDCVPAVREQMKPGDFMREGNQWVYEAIIVLYERREAINEITVGQELSRNGKLEAIGGTGALNTMVARLPTSIHAEYYAKIVHNLAVCRQAITIGGQIAALGYSAPDDSNELFNKAQKLLGTLAPREDDLITPFKRAEMLQVKKERMGEGNDFYLPFGFADMDRVIGGMFGGELIVIGARPSVGKSQLAWQIANNVAALKHNVLYVSLEMSVDQINERDIANLTGVSVREQRGMRQPELTWLQQMDGVADAISRTSIYTLVGRMYVSNVVNRAKVLKERGGLSLVVVDYMQLFKDKDDRKAGEKTYERVGYISRTLKGLAMELNIPVIALSQLSRSLENRDDKVPRMSDLRESGDIEQDADVILLPHRPEMYKPDDCPGQLLIKNAKQRQGGVASGLENRRMGLNWHADTSSYADF